MLLGSLAALTGRDPQTNPKTKCVKRLYKSSDGSSCSAEECCIYYPFYFVNSPVCTPPHTFDYRGGLTLCDLTTNKRDRIAHAVKAQIDPWRAVLQGGCGSDSGRNSKQSVGGDGEVANC